MPPVSIYPTTVARDTVERPWLTANLNRVRRAAAAYAGSDFCLAACPEKADLLLFVESEEPYLGDICRSPLFRQFRSRSFVYSTNDAAVPVLPGIYPDLALPLRLPDRHLGGFYLRSFDNGALCQASANDSPEFLFSFVGSVRNSPDVRGPILGIRHPRALLLDRSSGLRDDDLDYVKTLRSSKFVLCPRGLGPTSWRFYETMMAGRVPVIVSDRWVPAREIEWESFSIRVEEKDVASIPARCEALEDSAEVMGKRARREWDANCSLDRSFGWIGRRLLELRDACVSEHRHAAWRELTSELLFRRKVTDYLRWRTSRSLRRLAP